VAKELGVRYVLEGSVRRSGSRLRVTAQLVDGSSGEHIWAKNYDGTLEDVFEMQDRLTEQVAGTVWPKIELAEIERARRKRPDRLDAYDLYLKAEAMHAARHISDNAEVCRLLFQAVALDPHYAPALSSLAFALDARFSMGWEPFTHDDRGKAVDYARKAITEGSGDAPVLARSAIVLMHCAKDYDQAVQVAQTAMRTNSNDWTAILCAAVIELHCGDLEQSLALAYRAIELSPTDPGAHWALSAVAHADMALGRFEEAIQWAERSNVINPEYDPTFWMLIAANAQLGRMDAARKWLAGFLAMHPDMTVARLRAAQPDKYENRMAAILEGLRMAGLPEN
jgi:tetratricopeptide (TPR) repeat protein